MAGEATRGLQRARPLLVLVWGMLLHIRGTHGAPHGTPSQRLLVHYRSGWHTRNEPELRRRLTAPLQGFAAFEQQQHRRLLEDNVTSTSAKSQEPLPDCSPRTVDLHSVGLQLWELPPGCDVQRVTNHLSSLFEVAYEEDSVVHALSSQPLVPDDPRFSLQWMMREQRLPLVAVQRGVGGDWADRVDNFTLQGRITRSEDSPSSNRGHGMQEEGLPEDIEYLAGGVGGAVLKDGESRRKPLVIAIIDSGVDTTHPDLQGRLWVNEGEIPDNGVDDDGNGYVDDYHGYNFLAGSPDVFDDYFHGTHLAGIVGAKCDNDEGVCGMDQEALLMPCKFLDRDGSGLISNAVRCLDYALQMGAIMTLNSYGGYSHDSEVLKLAINAAEAAGQLFITAAGNNDGRDMDTTPQYPAASSQLNVVTVAATDMFGQLAPYSNVGVHTVDLAAPGSNIYSTLPGGKYGYRDGTSQAAGVVAGAMSLMMNAYRNAGFDIQDRASDFRNILMSAGMKAAPSIVGKVASGGILDVSVMLEAIPDSAEQALQSGWTRDSPLPYHSSATLGQVYGMSNAQTSAASMGVGLYYRDASVLSNTSITSFLHSCGSFSLCTTFAPDGRTIASVLPDGTEVSVATAEAGAALGRDVTADLLPAVVLSEIQANSDGSAEEAELEASREGVYWVDLPRWFEVDGANISRVGVTSRGALVATTSTPEGSDARGYLGDAGGELGLYPVNSGSGSAAFVSSSVGGEGQRHGTGTSSSDSNAGDSEDDVGLPYEADALYGELFAMAQRVATGRPGFVAAGLFGSYDLQRGGQVAVTTYPDRVAVTYLRVLPGPSSTSPTRDQQAPVTFVVEIFYSNAGGMPPGSVRTTFVEVGAVEGVTGALQGADDFRDGDEAGEQLVECVSPPELVLDNVASRPSALGIIGLEVTEDGKFSLHEEELEAQQHGSQSGSGSGDVVRQVQLANFGGQTLYSSVSMEPVGVNLLQSWQWLEPSATPRGMSFFGGSSDDAASMPVSDFDDGIGTLRVAAGGAARRPQRGSSTAPWVDELSYHQEHHSNPRYYGAIGSALRFDKPLRLPAMIKARPVRAAECEDHFIVVSTNSYLGGMTADSSNATHTFAFGLQCGRKTLLAGDSSVSSNDGCAGFGLLTWSVSISADRISFWDDACGALHIPGDFHVDALYYLYIGAGCSYGADGDIGDCPEGAQWTSFEVLKGLKRVSGLGPGGVGNVTSLPASMQSAFDNWHVEQLDERRNGPVLEYEDIVGHSQQGVQQGQSYSAREAPSAQRQQSKRGEGTVYAQATDGDDAAPQEQPREEGSQHAQAPSDGSQDAQAPSDGSQNAQAPSDGNQQADDFLPWYDDYSSAEGPAGAPAPSGLTHEAESISGWRPGYPGWLPGSTPAAEPALADAGFSNVHQEVKLSNAEQVVLQASWMGQQAPEYCTAELVLRTNDPLHATVRMPIRC